MEYAELARLYTELREHCRELYREKDSTDESFNTLFLQYEGLRKHNEKIEKELKLYKSKLAEKVSASKKADMFRADFPPITGKE